MYHPYLRGKQFELITIRETAPLLAAAKFCPIIEPVREALSGLHRALDAVLEANGHAIVVVNPHHGDLSIDGTPLTELLQQKYLNLPNISAGILLKPDTSLKEVLQVYEAHINHTPVLIHAGFAEGKSLAKALGKQTPKHCHVFFEPYCGKLYRKHFEGARRVLLRDGFVRKRNADYVLLEAFSDLHATYPEENMDGFGDFLIVGDEYSETGGPAWAVAIHLTFIDPDLDDVMQIYHFVSDTKDTPKDPAGKFGEALQKMVTTISRNPKVIESSAVLEFRVLHKNGHFPGLGYVKKLSMIHHIETLASYFGVHV